MTSVVQKNSNMLISKGKLRQGQLEGKVVIITGAGGGIGFEAARSLLWLGATVIISEINKSKGKKAFEEIKNEFGGEHVRFFQTDVSSERSVRRLYRFVKKTFGKADVIFNNATMAVTGAAHEVDIKTWDKSYGVNLRGPVLLLRYFLPDMIRRNEGIVVFVPSSGAAPYLGAYEVFKTSQVELGNTLAAELENTGVIAYSIGPGIVKTQTADEAIRRIAPRYGMTVDQFYELNSDKMLSAEEAGAGFAASVALAERYRGAEIGSVQALIDAGVDQKSHDLPTEALITQDMSQFADMISSIRETFEQQVAGWHERSIFEKQWILRDFKKQTGESPEFFIEILRRIELDSSSGAVSRETFSKLRLERLSAYYRHLIQLMKGYERNPEKAKEQNTLITGWIGQIEEFLSKYRL